MGVSTQSTWESAFRPSRVYVASVVLNRVFPVICLINQSKNVGTERNGRWRGISYGRTQTEPATNGGTKATPADSGPSRRGRWDHESQRRKGVGAGSEAVGA